MNLKTFRSDLVALWILLTSALCVGLLINQFRDHPLSLVYKTKAERLQESVKHIQANPSSPVVVATDAPLPKSMSLESVTDYVQARRGVILDARPDIFYRVGHIPGALSLPRDDFEHGYALLKEKLESNRSQPIVIYCSGAGCEDSQLVRNSLTALGFTNLALFEGGWSTWTDARKEEEISK